MTVAREIMRGDTGLVCRLDLQMKRKNNVQLIESRVGTEIMIRREDVFKQHTSLEVLKFLLFVHFVIPIFFFQNASQVNLLFWTWKVRLQNTFSASCFGVSLCAAEEEKVYLQRRKHHFTFLGSQTVSLGWLATRASYQRPDTSDLRRPLNPLTLCLSAPLNLPWSNSTPRHNCFNSSTTINLTPSTQKP